MTATSTDVLKLHHALKEALCLRHLLTSVIELPAHSRTVDYDEPSGRITFVVRDSTSGKEFRICVPDEYTHTFMGKTVTVPPGQFVEDWDFANDLWTSATPASRANIWCGSFAARRAAEIMAAIRSKGINVGLKRSSLRLIAGGIS